MVNIVKRIETSKGMVEVSQRGTGSPILMLHGSLENCNGDMGYEPLLNAGFSIITPSRPGYGNTPVEAGKSAEEAADLLAEMLEHMHIVSANVVAVSYGGLTGLHFASRHPDKTKCLILASAVTKPIDDAKRLAQAKKFYGKGHQNFWAMLQFVGKISKKSLVKRTYAIFSTCDTKEIMKEIKPDAMDAIAKFYDKKPENKGALLDLKHSINDAVFENITSPTLIIHSKEDKAVPFEHAENAKRKIRNSKLFIANTWGHFIWVGKGSDEVMNKIISFIS
jgi:pimeloyl-ACP methyl ester carboxylesterase